MKSGNEWKVAIDVSSVFETYGGGVGYSTSHLATEMKAILGEERIRFFSPLGRMQDIPQGGPFSGERPRAKWRFSRAYRFIYRESILPREIERFGPAVAHFPDAKVPRRLWNNDDLAVAITVNDLGAFNGQVPEEHAQRHRKTLEEGVASADLIISISGFTRKSLIDTLGVRPDKVKTIYYGISQLYEPLAPEIWSSLVKERFGLEAGYFLFVGEVNERKNLLPLVAAHHQLPSAMRRRHPLVIAGRIDRNAGGSRGVYVREVLSMVDDCVRLTYVVSEKEKLFLYNGALAFVFPSRYEGFGLPVLEAMACGKAVIALGNAVVRELHQGRLVMLEEGDPDEIRAALRDLVEDEGERTRLAEEGRKHAAAFTWRRAALQTIEAYAEAMRKKRA